MTSALRWCLCSAVAFSSAADGQPPTRSGKGGSERGDALREASARPGEWPQFAGSSRRNNAPPNASMPIHWSEESKENIVWTAQLGSDVSSCAVVSQDKVFIGTNNAAGRLKRYPPGEDLAILLCFRLSDGEFLWQFSSPRLGDRAVDWPSFGMFSAPCVRENRLYLVTNRTEIVCLDTEGHLDGEDDGVPDVAVDRGADAPAGSAPRERQREADVVWRYSLRDQLKVLPHNVSMSSPTLAGELVLANTGNGVDETHLKPASPDAPSFVALHAETGQLVWQDASPGPNILHGSWSSPAWANIGGVAQAVFAGGDGYLYSFDLAAMRQGKTDLLWWFDCNPKRSKWKLGGGGTRNSIVSTPVIYRNRVLIATGEDPETGDGHAALWCLDATRRGDLSPELVFNRSDPKTPIPHRRVQACDDARGDFTRPNPGQGVVWQYRGRDTNGAAAPKEEERFHRTIGLPVVRDGLVVIADHFGLIHCLDFATGRWHWVHDALSSITSTPVAIDGKVYVADSDGEVAIFRLAPEKRLLAEISMENGVSGTLVAVRAARGNTSRRRRERGWLLIPAKNRLVVVGDTSR